MKLTNCEDYAGAVGLAGGGAKILFGGLDIGGLQRQDFTLAAQRILMPPGGVCQVRGSLRRDILPRGGKGDLAGVFFIAGLQGGFDIFDVESGLFRAAVELRAFFACGFDYRRVNFRIDHVYEEPPLMRGCPPRGTRRGGAGAARK